MGPYAQGATPPSGRRAGALLAPAAALALLGAIGGAAAQVTLDGTANPDFAGALNGPDYQIRAELGRRAGSNLFHSFERFDLRTGESATFSGPNAVRNVISRVTGGKRSDIDGTLRSTIPGADLYFLNPAGVLFGPNARLDLQGSFHVSTADELRFADGARFSASDPAASSFTVATPEAFGFLGAGPGAITVDRSLLEVPAGQTLSLVGGDLTIDGGRGERSRRTQGVVRAAAGKIVMTALRGPGEASLTAGDPTAAAADIRLHQAFVDASGEGGGTIRIRSGRFVASSESFVLGERTGAARAGHGISLKAKVVTIERSSTLAADGTLALTADDLMLHGDGVVRGFGIVITAGNLSIRGGSIDGETVVISSDRVTIVSRLIGRETIIGSAIFGARRIEITAGDLMVSGDFGGGILSHTTEQRDAGKVVVRADRLTLRDQGEIGSDSDGEGDAGQVVVKARDLTLSGGFITSRTGIAGAGGMVRVTADKLTIGGGFGGISSETTGQGDAGSVVVRAGQLMMSGSGEISSDSFGGAEGNAGTVAVRADRLTMRGGSKISSETDEHEAGDAGGVTVTATVLDVGGDARISSAAANKGNAGRVTVSADRLRLDHGKIATSSASAGGGGIRITAEDWIDLRRSAVTASVAGGDDPTAGNILIDPKVLVIDRSTIEADARTGSGGNIQIVADNILVPEGDLAGLLARGAISASGATEAVNGTVTIRAPEIDLSGGLVVLATGLLDASSELRQRCGARRDVGASSFTGVGRAGLPRSPDGPLLSDYALQAVPGAESAGRIEESESAIGAVTLVLPCREPA